MKSADLTTQAATSQLDKSVHQKIPYAYVQQFWFKIILFLYSNVFINLDAGRLRIVISYISTRRKLNRKNKSLTCKHKTYRFFKIVYSINKFKCTLSPIIFFSLFLRQQQAYTNSRPISSTNNKTQKASSKLLTSKTFPAAGRDFLEFNLKCKENTIERGTLRRVFDGSDSMSSNTFS